MTILKVIKSETGGGGGRGRGGGVEGRRRRAEEKKKEEDRWIGRREIDKEWNHYCTFKIKCHIEKKKLN